MKTGLLINYSDDFTTAADEAVHMISAGVELIAIPEAYAFDAASQVAFLVARAPGISFTTSVIPIYSRTPALIAMTAATLDYLSGANFSLGLGTSGPQVVEGFHGVPYDSPLGRTREVVEICRAVWSGEKVAYRGDHYRLPLGEGRGTGLGKSLGLIRKPLRTRIPILLASLGPKNVALTAEIADGWQPLLFDPTHYLDVWGESLASGAARRSADLGPLHIHAQVPVTVGGPGDPGFLAIKRHYALYIGGMGAAAKNFYFNVACRYGFAAEAAEIQRRFLDGDKEGAAQAVPDALVEATSLTGSETSMRNRLTELDRVGVDAVYLIPFDVDADLRYRAVSQVATARAT